MPKFKAGMVNPVTGLPIERVGIAGSRYGPVTQEQSRAARDLFVQMWPFKELHHGCCVGWEEWVVWVVREMWGPYRRGGPHIHAWPPTNPKFLSTRAVQMSDVVHQKLEYKARDREVAYHSQALVGGPYEESERMTGGTWYTMRQALGYGRPVWFVRLDGIIVPEWKSEMNERIQAHEAKERESYKPTAALLRNAEWPPPERPTLDEAFGVDPQKGDPFDEIFG